MANTPLTFTVNATLVLAEATPEMLKAFQTAGEAAIPAGTLQHIDDMVDLQADGTYNGDVHVILKGVTAADLGAFVAGGAAAIPASALVDVMFEAKMTPPPLQGQSGTIALG